MTLESTFEKGLMPHALIIAFMTKRKVGRKSNSHIHILDIFKKKCTNTVNAFLENLSVKAITVPGDMLHFLQPLYLTVDGSAKHFMRKKLVNWFTEGEIDESTPTDQTEVNFNLTRLIFIHVFLST